ncbi:MAG TPA: alpha-hydroxy acid oxidase [Methylomirabilota bacterium]|nr:alpha-hydroxy acid oxidase [Methylomirabilota bacterium]
MVDELGRRLAAIVSLADFEPLARQSMEPGAFDYVAGGAWDELDLDENEAAWRRRRLRPRVLVDVSAIDPSTTMLGEATSMPLAIAPMAAEGLAHPDAEIAVARGAAAAGVPFILSTMSTRSMEDVAAGSPDGVRWFQLYTQADPRRSRSLVERAEAAGYEAIVVTVDLPVLGYRERDRRSGFDLPGPHGNLAAYEGGPTHAGGIHADTVDAGGFEELEESILRGVSWDDLATIRSWTSLPLVIKGVMTPEDAKLGADHGVDAIVVSNHGARQLDRVGSPLDVLEDVVAAVDGRTEVWVDGGVRRGLDLAIARALGARGVLVGRPIFWALAAGGQAGVERALAILREEFEIALALLGTPTSDDIQRDHVGGIAQGHSLLSER